jgi:hypothetical protein
VPFFLCQKGENTSGCNLAPPSLCHEAQDTLPADTAAGTAPMTPRLNLPRHALWNVVAPRGLQELNLCWPPGVLMQNSNGYLNASLPVIGAAGINGHIGTDFVPIDWTISVAHPSAFDYWNLTTSPGGFQGGYGTWSFARLHQTGNVSGGSYFAAIDETVQSSITVHSFDSGILLGICGGLIGAVLVSLCFLSLLSSRGRLRDTEGQMARIERWKDGERPLSTRSLWFLLAVLLLARRRE